jgi:Tol biopolymer transport system component
MKNNLSGKILISERNLYGSYWILLILGLLIIPLPSAFAQVPSVNGQIAFTVCEPSSDPNLSIQCDIWVMEVDGTGQKNLTNTPDLNETFPAWSPDGAKIAFIEGVNFSNRLMVINADGTGSTVITPNPTNQFAPSWSPGGTQLAIVRLLPGEVITSQFDIVVINVDGSGELNITNSDTDEVDPAWSPDGTKIAFAGVRLESTPDPVTGEPVPASQWEITTVNPDGTGEQILSAGDPGTSRSDLLEEDRSPEWSPDSSRLVFASQSVDPCCDKWKILIVNRDGSGITLLSDNPDVNDFSPSFSPDGLMIVFVSDRDATFGGDFDIYSIPVPAGDSTARVLNANAKRLTKSGNSSDADWGRIEGSLPQAKKYPIFLSLTLQEKSKGGKIKSTPKGIKCGKHCSQNYANGVLVTLIAKPRKRFLFEGWSGACSAAGNQLSCTITIDDAKVIGASFKRIP